MNEVYSSKKNRIKDYVTRKKTSSKSLWGNKRPKLIHLDIELTERCNNNCIHCYNNLPAGDSKAKKRELSTIEIKNILSEAASLGCIKVRFTGGEPLLRKDFEELYIFTRKLGIRVVLFTNATLITPSIIKTLSQVPPLEKIEVSLFGMKKGSYQSVSQLPGSFKAARKGIELLVQNKLPFIVKGAFLPQNKSDTQEFESWAESVVGMQSHPSYSMFFNLRSRRDSEQKNREIQMLRIQPDEGLEIMARESEAFILNRLMFCSRFCGLQGDVLFSCGAGLNSGCVDAYGSFKLCVLLNHPDTIYNLKQGTLKEALEDFFPKIKRMKTTNPDYLNRCGRCFLKALCEQCPAQSWMESGNLDIPIEYYCSITHSQARYLHLLKPEEKSWEITDWEERLKSARLKMSLQAENKFAHKIDTDCINHNKEVPWMTK